MQNLLEIGVLGKPHGIKGEIRFSPHSEAVEDFLEEGRYLLVKGLPYRLLSVRDISGPVLRLEGVEDRNAAEMYKGAAVSLPYSEALQEALEEDDLAAWQGWTIRDLHSGRDVGPILEVLEMSSQLTAYIVQDGVDVFIPMHEDLIHDVDTTHRILSMDLPEGLLELYL
jgi:16S rRNA processing protein RimM